MNFTPIQPQLNPPPQNNNWNFAPTQPPVQNQAYPNNQFVPTSTPNFQAVPNPQIQTAMNPAQVQVGKEPTGDIMVFTLGCLFCCCTSYCQPSEFIIRLYKTQLITFCASFALPFVHFTLYKIQVKTDYFGEEIKFFYRTEQYFEVFIPFLLAIFAYYVSNQASNGDINQLPKSSIMVFLWLNVIYALFTLYLMYESLDAATLDLQFVIDYPESKYFGNIATIEFITSFFYFFIGLMYVGNFTNFIKGGDIVKFVKDDEDDNEARVIGKVQPLG